LHKYNLVYTLVKPNGLMGCNETGDHYLDVKSHFKGTRCF